MVSNKNLRKRLKAGIARYKGELVNAEGKEKKFLVGMIGIKTEHLKEVEFKIKNPEKPNNRTAWLKLRFDTFKRDNFTCKYCGRDVVTDDVKLECDHIKPASDGGEDLLKNLITACYECNRGKGDYCLNKREEEKRRAL